MLLILKMDICELQVGFFCIVVIAVLLNFLMVCSVYGKIFQWVCGECTDGEH